MADADGMKSVWTPGDGQVHLGLGHLALEVGHGPQALDDEVGADLLGHVDHELGEVHDA